MKFLSIIIPCYNLAQYIRQTIDSLQALKNAEDCEFIFVNDGSTDSTLSIIQEFALSDSRVIVINQKNAGVSAARNAALKVANGKYCIPLDGDDHLLPDTVDIIKRNIKNADLLITPIQEIKEQTSRLHPLTFEEGTYTPATLFESCRYFPTGPKPIYRLSIIRRFKLCYNENIHAGEVFAFTCLFMSQCNLISVSHEYFYQYIMRDTSAVHAPNFAKDLSVLRLFDYVLTQMAESIKELSSLNVTLFRLCSSFTYNKYAKLGLTDSEALEVVSRTIHYPAFRKCAKRVLASHQATIKDRMRVLYMLTTEIWGYRLLAHINARHGSRRR